MAGTFRARIDELQDRVGRGNLVMRTNVHQPYAAAEHQRYYYKHPRGGQPDFLETPFMVGHGEMLDDLAHSFPDLREAATIVVAKFQEWVETLAPVEQGALRDSVNLYVEDDGYVVYERPQEAPYESWKE